jgi:hypothetical protein
MSTPKPNSTKHEGKIAGSPVCASAPSVLPAVRSKGAPSLIGIDAASSVGDMAIVGDSAPEHAPAADARTTMTKNRARMLRVPQSDDRRFRVVVRKISFDNEGAPDVTAVRRAADFAILSSR